MVIIYTKYPKRRANDLALQATGGVGDIGSGDAQACLSYFSGRRRDSAARLCLQSRQTASRIRPQGRAGAQPEGLA